MCEVRLFSIKMVFMAFLALAFIAIANAGEEELKRHMVRGTTAMKMATSPRDFKDAVEEFKQAIQLEPDWADAWYNLGVAQNAAGDYQHALESFKTYLKKAPEAKDRKAVENTVYELEYKVEKLAKERPRLLMKIVEEYPEQLTQRVSGSGAQEPCCRILGPFWANVTVHDKKIEIRNLKNFTGPDEDGWPLLFSGDITGQTVSGIVDISYQGDTLKYPFEGSFSVGERFGSSFLELTLHHQMGVLYNASKNGFVPAPRTSEVIYTWTFGFSFEDSELPQ